MALIKCPECGRDVSESAVSCPNCGHPIGQVNKNIIQIDSAPKKRKKYRVRVVIFGFMAVIGVLFTGGAFISGFSGNGWGALGLWLIITIVGFIGLIASGIGGFINSP